MRPSKIQGHRPVSVLAVAIHVAFSTAAWAGTLLPQGASVANGQATISKPTDSSLLVNASSGAIVNWQQFSIGSNGQVRIALPSASSAMLNRVVGADTSHILGSLQSNGRVFLINPNGIVVGAGARIDANSFIASTLDLSDGDFLAGKLRFLANSGAGGIRNEGVITAGPGGRIALIAPDVQNTGIIQAPDGQILLAAGRKLEISSLDFEGVTFEIQSPTDSVLNLGKLLAENGAVSAFAGTLRHSGEIRASRMLVDGDGSIRLSGNNELTLSAGSLTSADGVRGGRITLQSAEGTTQVAGTVSATGSMGAGGSIEILGNRVALEAGARVDASGASSGGQILVGGDFQGKNAAVQNASRVYVDATATIQADATQAGDGGKVVVWADENTRYFGSLSARGGASGGKGGSAEVSGKQNLEFVGSADLGAPAGLGGSLLLDPLDILVKTLGGILPGVVDQFADFSANVVTISPTALNNVKGNVTLQAARDIYFNDAVSLTTAGAGLSATAGGATYDAVGGGQIYINQALNTTGGAVTLRGVGVSGAGTLTTAGGAVDIKTSGSEGYAAAINSGGGTVSLQAQTGAVSGANVNAGSGVINVTAVSGISGGTYSTTGNITLTTSAGSISNDHITAGTATLSATGGAVSNEYVNAATAVNASASAASASNASISLYNLASQPLRVGTLTAAGSVSLSSDSGFTQASGGLATAPEVRLDALNAGAAIGTVAAPLSIATPILRLDNLAAGAHIALSGNPTLTELRLTGNLAGLSSTTLTGAANLSSFALGNSAGALNISADSGTVSGFGTGFEVKVTDAGITAPTLNLTGGIVKLTSNAGLTIGTLNAASLYSTAKGAVSLGSISTTGSYSGYGIYVWTKACTTSYVGCSAVSPISATSLSSTGTGQVYLSTLDNGDITITGGLHAASASLNAGGTYRTSNLQYFPYYVYSQATTNNIDIALATTTGSFSANNSGIGDITLRSLAAGGSVDVSAGNTYYVLATPYPYYTAVTTLNNISVSNVEPSAATNSFWVSNNGIGNISVTGAVTRPSGSITLNASNGSVNAAGNLSANSSISASAGSNALTLANVASNNSISLSAGGDVSFLSINSSASNSSNGTVSLTSTTGSIKTRQDNTTADVSTSGNVSITANDATHGVIGDSAFANPMDVVAGTLTTNTVTLSAGLDIGAAGKPVNVDTVGVLSVSSAGGKFFVSAQTPDAATQRNLSGIVLAASAAGLGSGGTSSLSSKDLSVNAISDGSLITIGDIVRSVGSLNAFSFTTTSGGLNFGNVNLSTAGYNQVLLTSAGAMTQLNPMATNNIAGGYIHLIAGSNALVVGNVTSSTAGANSVGNLVEINGGDITTGSLSGPGIKVSGTNLSLGSVTSSGINRNYNSNYLFVPHLGYNQYVTDELMLSASATLATSGNISSNTSATVTGAGISVGGGSGTLTGGHTNTSYYADHIVVQSGAGTLATGAIDGYDVTLGSANFTTGNVSATRALNITANASGSGTYVPGAIALGAANTDITAANGIDLTAATLTSPGVKLTTTTGNIQAPLTGTSSLTIRTGGQFVASSTTALGTVDVTANGLLVGGGGGSSVTDSANPLMQAVNAGNALTLAFKPSSGSTALSYRETNATLTDITASTTGSLASGSSILISAPTAQVTTPSVALSNGTLNISTGGNINLTSVGTGGGRVIANSSGGAVNLASVTTSGGQVDAYARTGDMTLTQVSSGGGAVVAETAGTSTNVNVVSVNSGGGSVSLTSDNGNLVAIGAGLHIDSSIANGSASSGTTTLNAANGNVGSGAAQFKTRGAASLAVSSRDAINVDVAATPLTNLSITTTASGTGAVSVTNSNYSGLTLARSTATDMDLSGVNPASPGAFYLKTNDGNINVKSDIGNVAGLTLIAATGDINIAATGGVARTVISSAGMTLQAGRDVNIAAGAAAAEAVTVQSNAAMGITAGRDIAVTGGSAAGSASAWVRSVGGSQTLNATGNLLVRAGAGSGAYAAVQAGQTQTLYANNVSVLGGGDGAYASLQGGSQSLEHIYGNALVQGGSGAGAYAEVVSTSSFQRFGNQSNYYYGNVTDSMRILGGGGSGAYASVRSADTQDVHSVGDIQVVAGSGVNANAELKAASRQSVGWTENYYYTPTANVLVQASSTATARILASTSQSVQGGGIISVLGGDAAGMAASIEVSGGSQTVGTSSISNNVPTAGIVVQAGNGGAAWIKASGSQTFMTGGDITVTAGSGLNATASIESTAGSQTIGDASNAYYSNDPNNNITIQGGTGTGAAAWIKAATGQTIDAGGNINVTGGAAWAYAEMVTTTGTQTIGNQTLFNHDQTNTIALTGGSAANSYARIAALTGSQNVQASTGIHLTGGSGDNAGALLLAATGQTINTAADLAIVGGSGTTIGGNESGLRNTTSGAQSVQATTGISIAGGGSGADTWIKQAGTGAQNMVTNGNLAMAAATAGADITSIDAAAGGQTLAIGGTVTLNNAGSHVMQIASGANQTISTDSLAITLSSTTGAAPLAAVTATGNQTLVLNGVESTTLATLNVANMSAAAGSQALLQAGGNQVIGMNYLSAGKMTIGDVNAQGASLVKAVGDQTVVAGELLIQGGATAAASSTLKAGTPTTGTLLVSTLSGPVSVLGGAAGPAAMDPLNLSVVSNGSILLTGGSTATASSNVTAGVINMAATNGNMLVVGGAAPATVVAATTATVPGANTFNLTASGGLTVTPNAGGASISALAGGNVILGAPCFGCTTGLLGPFSLTAPLPPPVVTVSNVPNLLVADITLLLDQAAVYFDLVLSEDGTLTSRRRSLAQCY